MADSSGNGNTGMVSGATWAAAGKYGSALSFNGSRARVNIPNSASLQLSSGMTLEAWVDAARVTSAWRDVLYKANDNYYLEATSDNAGLPAGGGIMGGSHGEAYGTKKLTANSWTYLSLTYDGSAVRLYVNGSLVSTTAKSGALATSTNQLQIGGDSLYDQYFNGLIDEVRVYNTALSAGQIQTDMATPISGGTSDTQAPTQPGTLGANAASSSTINLSWGASSDNVGVTGYQIERCQGSGCSNFSQIATTTRQHNQLQRHRPHRQHQLQLPRPRHRRRRQHQPLQQHRHHHHTEHEPAFGRRDGLGARRHARTGEQRR